MILRRALPADTDLLALQRANPARFPLLLESVAGGNALSRWDLLLRTDGDGLRLDRDGATRRLDGTRVDGNFLDALDGDWQAARVPLGDESLPFRGGWALYLGYELAGQIEPVLSLPMPVSSLPPHPPVALALRCPAAVLRDRVNGECFAIAEPGGEALLAALDPDLALAAALPALPEWIAPSRIWEDRDAAFLDGVAAIQRYLRAGDVFQVNLSRAWRAGFELPPPDPTAFYQRLREANPAPFAGLLMHDGWALASSSPERLVSVHGDVAQTRPIAGTRPRFAGDDDGERMRELVGHPKERAEHVMLIDLERNDLGRVCEPGSVHVDELMSVESYAHVHHIVSNVRGRLRPGTTPGAVIAAVFPGGTITGCPKVRCMQIIAELELVGRGPYTGSLGYLNRDGDMDLNILIRTAWIRGCAIDLRAGAGIVIDSDAARELEETRHKARGLLRALGGTEANA